MEGSQHFIRFNYTSSSECPEGFSEHNASVLGCFYNEPVCMFNFFLPELYQYASLLIWQCRPGQEPGERCPCIDAAPTLRHSPYFTRMGDLKSLACNSTDGLCAENTFPLSYGSSICKAHDSGLGACQNDLRSKPDWCNQRWCYVDAQKCSVGYRESTFWSTGKEDKVRYGANMELIKS